MSAEVSVTASALVLALVTTRLPVALFPTVVAPKVLVAVAPVVVVFSVVPTIPDTTIDPTDVRVDAPLLSSTAVNAPASSSVMALPSAVTVPPER